MVWLEQLHGGVVVDSEEFALSTLIAVASFERLMRDVEWLALCGIEVSRVRVHCLQGFEDIGLQLDAGAGGLNRRHMLAPLNRMPARIGALGVRGKRSGLLYVTRAARAGRLILVSVNLLDVEGLFALDGPRPRDDSLTELLRAVLGVVLRVGDGGHQDLFDVFGLDLGLLCYAE